MKLDIIDAIKPKDQIEEVKQTKVEHQHKFLKRERYYNGHKCFEYNTKTKELKEALFEEEVVKFTDAMQGNVSTSKKVVINVDSLYVTALNRKNAIKKFKKIHNINIK